ncbi:hypothetical protein MUK51_19525 [Sphingobacterium faecium]|uniref:hypothetical protein n=1 Tax=Sphingobacterium faecium TaxID=34087 RepID=UPI0021B58DD8|nr:hypothetical protein [Sphingobacterium faecium]UXD69356.1 hypothetical protein MUK51_19525 [Sphingobacterium faecium]
MSELNLWEKTLASATNLPFVKVNRIDFLTREIKARYNGEFDLEHQIPSDFLNNEVLGKIAEGCIKYHLTIATTTSAATGIPGGIFMLGTIPADIVQTYAHALCLMQKLLYIYGFEDLNVKEGKVDDETLQILTIYMGVMLGANSAIKFSNNMLAKLSVESAKRIPRYALTKFGIYQVSKEISKWLGISLTKATFSRGISKFIPLIGAPISGGLTYITFKKMAYRLNGHLRDINMMKNS